MMWIAGTVPVHHAKATSRSGGWGLFYVLNRAVGRMTIVEKPEDYAALFRCVALAEAAVHGLGSADVRRARGLDAGSTSSGVRTDN